MDDIKEVQPITSENKPNSGHFVGRYVEDIRDLAIASSLAATHAIVVGPPGTGKTSILLAALNRMYTPDKTCIIRFKPTTPAAKVDGIPNYAKLMTDNPVFELVTDGTPYDPEVRVILADEFPRAREDALDAFLDVMDKIENKNGDVNTAIVLGTANFLPKDERAEATLDRFSMFMWIDNPHNSIAEVAANIMGGLGHNLDLDGEFPTWKEIEGVRKWKPGSHAIEAVSKVIDSLFKVAEEGVTDSGGNVVRTFTLNYRLVEQMCKVLFRVSAFYHNNADFDTVHPKAVNALRWMYKSKSRDEARDWETLVGMMSDPIQTAIDRLMEDAYAALREVKKANSNRMTAAAKMAATISQKLSEASLIIPQDDPRMSEAMATLQEAVATFTRTGDI